MKEIQVHAVEGKDLLSLAGCRKLEAIGRKREFTHRVFVISAVKEGPFGIEPLLSCAKRHDERLWSRMETRFSAWSDLVESLLSVSVATEARERIKQGFSDIEDLLKAIWLVEDVSTGSVQYLDNVVSSWIADICRLYFHLHDLDAECAVFGDAMEYKTLSSSSLFVSGCLPQPEYPALGEGLSEYASALLGARLQASQVVFWNNRSLLRSADLAEVPSARVIPSLSYSEATELSFFGAPIVHPLTLLPAIDAAIEVELRWWGDVEQKGTRITKEDGDGPIGRVKGFSTIHDVALINVEGAGMSGVVGIAGRLFSAMRQAGISVILISQASSEYSICFAVPGSQMEQACETAGQAFEQEIREHSIASIDSEPDCAILAAVGRQMTGQAGVAGKFFSSLGKAGVNVRAIAQGSSETNISAVIKQHDSTKALRALHAAFFLSKQALSMGLLGPGNIGGTLLNQIASESSRLKEDFGLDIHIRGIANSRLMLLDDDGIDPENWRKRFDSEAVPLDLERFANHIGVTYYPHSLIVDCTTSSMLAEQYVRWLEQGSHVITPNKKAGTTAYPYYRSIFETCRRTGRRFLYETTVGAGLPVLGTLKDLVQTGDRVHRIEGIVSGTLAWLFNAYDKTVPFSTLVRKAREMGYTEPDPRDDLSGMDVGRKAVILARELGYVVEVADIPIQSLVPESLQQATVATFLDSLEELDGSMEKLYDEAAAKGEKLRYVALVDEKGNCSASLKSFPPDHPFAQATGTDNVICYTTDRYLDQPLVVKGPGAGRDVTAGGVFSDILRLAAYLGARI